jgi:hypothetical protein
VHPQIIPERLTVRYDSTTMACNLDDATRALVIRERARS